MQALNPREMLLSLLATAVTFIFSQDKENMPFLAAGKMLGGPVKPKTASVISPAQMEVRKRLEAVIDRPKKLRFHLDPERLKKLKALLLKKAAEDIKADQEKKAQERRRALTETIGRDEHSSLEDAATLMAICKKYHHRIHQLQETKYDLEVVVRKRDYMLNELTIQINQLRGKFVKPSLKSIIIATSDKNLKSSTLDVQNKAFARSFRRSLRAPSTHNNTGQAEDARRTGTPRPDWVTQTSRKSDSNDIPEQNG